jgi:ATP-binding cassette subfamily B protein
VTESGTDGAAGGSVLVPDAPQLGTSEIFRRFWPFTQSVRRFLPLVFVLLAAAPIIDAVQVWMYKLVIDDVLLPHKLAPFFWIAAAYIGLSVLAGLASFGSDYVSAWVGERFLLELRTGLFRHLQGLSLDFFERRRLGDVISRLTGDAAAIEALVLSGIANACSYAVQIVVVCGLLFYLQWELALVSIAIAPFVWLTSRMLTPRIKRASRASRRRYGAISAVAEETLSNIQLVQAYNRQDTEVARFHEESLGSFRATIDSARTKAVYYPIIGVLRVVAAMVVIGLGVWELSRGHLTVGGVIVFLAYLGSLYRPMRRLGRLGTTVQSAAAGAERIAEFLAERPTVTDAAHARRMGRARGAVSLEGVFFAYPSTDRAALADVSFAAEPGELVALVGRSGAGKSTIAKLLLRFYDPTSGAVRLDGHDLRELQLASLRENIAVLLQEALVFNGTIRDNIAYGLAGATDDDIVRAAEAADADVFIRALPDGYDTIVGQRGQRLSGGQRQRIAIARAMVRDAPLLILDEPTTGLDAEAAGRIIAPLHRLMSGRTTIVISHSFLTVQDASRILVLDEGRVVEQGDHLQLLARGGLYSHLYYLQQPHAASDSEPTPAVNGAAPQSVQAVLPQARDRVLDPSA